MSAGVYPWPCARTGAANMSAASVRADMRIHMMSIRRESYPIETPLRCVMEHHVSYDIRRAGAPDSEAMAAAHLDSIRSIGPGYYDDAIVRDWGARVQAGMYLRAMKQGEVFFIAVDRR